MKSSYAWMTNAARMTLGMTLVLSALAASAHAAIAPEIDPGSMGSALTLVIGGALMLTRRVRKS